MAYWEALAFARAAACCVALLVLDLCVFPQIMAVSGTVYVDHRGNASVPMWEQHFADAPAAFGPRVPKDGVYGTLVRAEPLDACSKLTNGERAAKLPEIWFAVVERSTGKCGFDVKAMEAERAGASGVIVFDNIPGERLVTMGAAIGLDIKIPSVFVTHEAGMHLLGAIREAGSPGPSARITPDAPQPTWSMLAMTLIAMVVVACVLTTFYFVQRQRGAGAGPQSVAAARGTGRATAAQVRKLKCIRFRRSSVLPHGADSCSICLEDFEVGDKVKLLRCEHAFHQKCVDKWLTSRNRVCPLCKCDPFAEPDAAADENTPLLPVVESDASGVGGSGEGPSGALQPPQARVGAGGAGRGGRSLARAPRAGHSRFVTTAATPSYVRHGPVGGRGRSGDSRHSLARSAPVLTLSSGSDIDSATEADDESVGPCSLSRHTSEALTAMAGAASNDAQERGAEGDSTQGSAAGDSVGELVVDIPGEGDAGA